MSNPESPRLPLAKRTWIPVGLAVLGGIIGVAMTVLAKPLYRTSLQVLVFPSNTAPAASLLLGPTATPQSQLAGIFTSRPMHLFIAKTAGRTEDQIDREYTVRSDPSISQVEIILDLNNPEEARAILPKIAAEAQRIQRASVADASSAREAQLKKVLDERMARYSRAQDDLSAALREAKSPVSSVAKLAELTTGAQTQRALVFELETSIRRLKEQLKTALNSATLPKSPTDPTSAELQALDELRITADRARADLKAISERYQPGAPEYAAADAKAEAAEAIYKREADAYRQAVAAGLNTQISQLQTQLSVAKYRAESLEKLSRSAPEASLNVRNQVRQVETLQSELAELRSSYEVAKIETEVERTRWAPVGPPITEERPMNKRYARTPLASAALGFLVGVLWLIATGPRPGARA